MKVEFTTKCKKNVSRGSKFLMGDTFLVEIHSNDLECLEAGETYKVIIEKQ